MEDIFAKALRLLDERLLEQHGFTADIIITKISDEDKDSSVASSDSSHK